MPPCRLSSQPSPATSSTADTDEPQPGGPAGRLTVFAARPEALQRLTRRRIPACSSSGALRQISASPATLNTCGQP